MPSKKGPENWVWTFSDVKSGASPLRYLRSHIQPLKQFLAIFLGHSPQRIPYVAVVYILCIEFLFCVFGSLIILKAQPVLSGQSSAYVIPALFSDCGLLAVNSAVALYFLWRR